MRDVSTQPASATPVSLKRASIALLVWSLLYAFPHLYWGLGGTEGLSTLKPTAPDEPGFEAANVVAFFFISLTGFLGLALVWLRDVRLPRRALLGVCGIGAAVALAHGAYGIIFRLQEVTGLREVDGEAFDRGEHGWVLWDLVVIEPWFVVEGLLLWLVGFYALSTSTDKKRWLLVTSGLTVLTFISAVAGLQVG